MSSLDLDIKNYGQKDLEKFFKVSGNYTYSNIELKETQIREQLLKSGHINSSTKRNLIQFLNGAKQKLAGMKKLIKADTAQPTTFSLSAQLDTTPYKTEEISRETELNIRDRTPYVFSHPTDFLPGNINPLKTRIISKCLTIDTRYRGNYFTSQSSDFNFQLPVTLNRVVSMQISSFEIPVSFYGISQYNGNNFLYLAITYNNENNDLIKYASIITINDGNYTSASLISTLNVAISKVYQNGNATAAADTTDPNGMISLIKFVLAIDPTTGTGNGLCYITSTSTNTLSAEMDFTVDSTGVCDAVDYSNKIGWNLGFHHKQYSFVNYSLTDETFTEPPIYFISGGTTAVQPTYTISGKSDTLVEPSTTRYLYLAVEDYNRSVNDTFSTAFYQSIISPDIIARIPINKGYFGVLMENILSLITEPRIYFGPVDIQRLRVRLYDDKGRIVQMNNTNYAFSLVFKMMYDL